MRVGDKVQYNKKYSPNEVVTILEILDNHALIIFPSGAKIATPLTGLWPLQCPTLIDLSQPTLFDMNEFKEVV